MYTVHAMYALFSPLPPPLDLSVKSLKYILNDMCTCNTRKWQNNRNSKIASNFIFLFQIMANKKHGKQNRKRCGIYKRHFLYPQLKFVGLK